MIPNEIFESIGHMCFYQIIVTSPRIMPNSIDLSFTFLSVPVGNDDRYMNYVQDLKISVFETLIRSLAHGKLEIHRQFPKAESLKDCK